MRSGTHKLTGKQMMALMEPFEVIEAFEKALEKLDDDDRAAIKKLISEAFMFRNVGRTSALELMGKLCLYLFEVKADSL